MTSEDRLQSHGVAIAEESVQLYGGCFIVFPHLPFHEGLHCRRHLHRSATPWLSLNALCLLVLLKELVHPHAASS